MSVTGPTTTLQAILNQIQAPSRPAAAARAAALSPTAPSTAAPAARPVAQAQAAGTSPNGAASHNPNAPRGTYLNIVV
jgi:hypothetical protein